MLKFITNRIKSFGPALKGLFWLFKNEGNAQFHLIVTIVVIIAGFYFKVTIYEWILLCFAIGLVITAEALNTAIEKTIDLLHPQKHEKAHHPLPNYFRRKRIYERLLYLYNARFIGTKK